MKKTPAKVAADLLEIVDESAFSTEQLTDLLKFISFGIQNRIGQKDA